MTKTPKLSLVSVLVLGLMLGVTEASFKRHRVTVNVTNNLEQSLDLVLHCKDKNHDLGEQTLHTGQTFSFTFRPNFWGTDLYFCSFQWAPDVFNRFDIYELFREPDVHQCIWSVTKEKPCRFSPKTNQYDICYEWTKS